MPTGRSSQLLGAAAFVAMTLAWLIPNHFPPWTSFYNDSAMALALVLLAGAHAATIARSPVPLFAWVAIGLACIPWLQWLGGLVLYSGDAIVSSLYLLGGAGFGSRGSASGP